MIGLIFILKRQSMSTSVDWGIKGCHPVTRDRGKASKQSRAGLISEVWVDEGSTWMGQIEKVRAKVGQLVGVLGRAAAALSGRSLLSLYNGLVLPHLQYCLMVWGDFQGCRNVTLAGSLFCYQKRCAGLVAGIGRRYHADPLCPAWHTEGW